MGDVITRAVLENVKADPPEFCHWEDEEWQQKALKGAGIRTQVPLAEILADRLPREYDYIRAFHSCRPTNVESYYKNGLLPADIGSLNDLATEYFLNPPKITEEALMRACKAANRPSRGGNSYFILDDRILTTTSPHYLESGSEYLQVIASKLGENCPELLKTLGVPTIFTCDVPISNMARSVRHLSGRLMECLFEEFIRPQWTVPSIDFTITIAVKLPPNLIVSHVQRE